VGTKVNKIEKPIKEVTGHEKFTAAGLDFPPEKKKNAENNGKEDDNETNTQNNMTCGTPTPKTMRQAQPPLAPATIQTAGPRLWRQRKPKRLSLLLSNSLSWQSRILPFRSITILETDV
jgi:hypothetical protein